MILLILLFVVAVGIGLIRGGRISNLTHIKIRRPWLIFLSVLVEYILIYLMRNTSRITQPLACLFLFLQYLLLFLFLWENRMLSYIWLIGMGSFLNFLVILVNKGSMPLSKAAMTVDANSRNMQYLANGKYLTYHILNSNSKLWLLGDVIFVPPPVQSFLSIGDIILFLGILLLIQDIIAGNSKRKAS